MVVLTPASTLSSRRRSATGRGRGGHCDSCYFPGCKKDRATPWVLGNRVLGFLVCLCLLWVLETGLSGIVSSDFVPKLTAETIKQTGEEFGVSLGDLKGRLRVLQQKIEREIGEKIFDCSSDDSIWEFKQESESFFYWKCVIYKFMAVEVSVWGSPLSTSGLLSIGSSPKFLTLLSGRITEWLDWKLISTQRTSSSSSWSYKKWSSKTLQLDADTWVLEYHRSTLFEGSGLMSAVCKVLRQQTSKLVKKLKHELWRLLLPDALPGSYHQHPKGHFAYPT